MSADFFNVSPEEQAGRMAQLATSVLQEWGITDATLRLIKYRENAVFEVQHGGNRHALRMHRAGYHSDAELLSELQWMGALSTAGIFVPTVVPTIAGELFISRAGDGLPDNVQIDLFEWIEGRQLGSVEEGLHDDAGVVSTFSTIGEIAAQVHNQASSWELPAGFARHAWDADGLAGDHPFWGRFWEIGIATTAEAATLVMARDTVHRELRRLSKSRDRFSMIHADFAPENLLIDGDNVRLIDFDDAGFGWHLFEIATSLYFFREETIYDAAKDALIRGYRRHRELTDEHLENLPLLMLARGLTYVGWVHTRSETKTAKEMGPALLEMALGAIDEYFNNPK